MKNNVTEYHQGNIHFFNSVSLGNTVTIIYIVSVSTQSLQTTISWVISYLKSHLIFTNPDVSLNNCKICADGLDKQYLDIAFLTEHTVYPFPTRALGVGCVINLHEASWYAEYSVLIKLAATDSSSNTSASNTLVKLIFQPMKANELKWVEFS